MSETFKKLKDDFLQSRIDKDMIKARLLSCIIGDIEAQSKRISNPKETLEDKALAVLKQMLKKTDDFLSILEKQGNTNNKQILIEKNIIETYLPRQLSYEELRAIILTNIDKPIDFSTAMKYLKSNHNGCYDGKLASQVIKEIMEGNE